MRLRPAIEAFIRAAGSGFFGALADRTKAASQKQQNRLLTLGHPIHLHGLWSELENGHGEFNPYKHTVIVKPAERLSYLVTADTPGRWAYHCHFMFHMDAGMFRAVVVRP